MTQLVSISVYISISVSVYYSVSFPVAILPGRPKYPKQYLYPNMKGLRTITLGILDVQVSRCFR